MRSRIQDPPRLPNISGANRLTLRLMHFKSNEQNLTRSKFFPSLIYYVKPVHREYERNVNVDKDVTFFIPYLFFFSLYLGIHHFRKENKTEPS